MSYDLYLTWRNLRTKPIQTFIPLLIVALAIALSTSVLALGNGVRQGIVDASDPFGVLVVGPKGSAQQLVLNSILLQGVPVGTIPYDVYERLDEDERVRFAVPMAKGDNVGGAPIIGTNENFYELRRDTKAPPAFDVVEGRRFEEPFEAVLGARAAEQLGLGLGDQFQAAHGTGPALASDMHEQVYTVVGILGTSNSPYDAAVFTPVESIWRAHGGGTDEHDDPAAEEEPPAPPSAANTLAVNQSANPDSLTSILVAPVGFVETGQIWTEFYSGTEAQAVYPGRELGQIFDLLTQAEQVLTIIGYLVLVIAAMTLFLSIYSVTMNRLQEIAIMRSVGGSRLSIFRMVVFETLLITVLGAVLGRIIGYATAGIIAAVFTQQSAIPIPITFLGDLEPLLWVLTLIVGVVAGLVPAAAAYRVDVVEHLFAS